MMRISLILLVFFVSGAASTAWNGAYAQKPGGPVDTITEASRAEFAACHQAVKRSCFKSEERTIDGRMTTRMRGYCNNPLSLGKTREGYGVFATFDTLWTDAESFGRHGPPPFANWVLLTDTKLSNFRDLTYEKARADKPVRDGVIDPRVGAMLSTVHFISTCIVKSAALAVLDAYGNSDEKAAITGAGMPATGSANTPK